MAIGTVKPGLVAPFGPIVSYVGEQTTVVARVVLEQGRYSWVWVVKACPYCGKHHHHYGGPLDGNPYKFIGSVLSAHCDKLDWPHHTGNVEPGDLCYVLAPAQPDERSTCHRHARIVLSC